MTRMNGRVAWALIIVGLTVASLSRAQQPPPIPSTVAPGSIEREQNHPREPQAVEPGQPLTLKLEQSAPPANASQLTFTLQSLEVVNSKAFSSGDLVASYRNLVGQTISVQKLYEIAAEMTVRYRKADFVLSTVIVPQQTIDGGHAQLQAVEGYVAKISIEGDTRRRPGLLQSMQKPVLNDHPLRSATLERFLLLLNDLPGITAQGILQPSAATPGASDLLVRMQQMTVSGTVAVNNRGSALQGPVQFQTGLSSNSQFGSFDDTSLQYLQAGRGSELRYYSLSHSERLTATGLEVTGNASHSRSDTALGEALASNNLQTDNTVGRLEASMPLRRSRVSNLYVHAALTYSDSETDAIGARLNHDIISAFRVGASVDLRDAAAGVNVVDMEFSKGFNAMGASRYGDPLASRPGGRPDFSKLTANLARLQSLGVPFSLLLAVNGQYAFDKVLINEEFAYGGEYFGRAYDASELVGDSGVAVKAELRYTLELPRGFTFTFYGFGEDGFVWRRITTDITAPDVDHAVSVGGGARYSLTHWLSGYVEYAKPVHHVVQVYGDERSRVFAGLQFNFSF
jgi:hemolysin activation/secretion protein